METRSQTYALDRLLGILQAKGRKLKEECSKPRLPVTQGDLQRMIKNGEILVVDPMKKINECSSLCGVFSFPKDWAVVTLSKDYTKRIKELNKLYTIARDAVLLNPAVDLYKVVERFEAVKV